MLCEVLEQDVVCVLVERREFYVGPMHVVLHLWRVRVPDSQVLVDVESHELVSVCCPALIRNGD